MSSPGELVSLGCDYITTTARDVSSSLDLHEAAEALLIRERNQGNTLKPWGMSGFSGFRAGECELGTRGREVMCRLSGGLAFREWSKVWSICDNVPRFDLQATVRWPRKPSSVIASCKRQALRKFKEKGERLVVRGMWDARGGYTLYLGHRQSICFGRIYDKWHKTPEDCFQGTVRYEVQFHNRLAKAVAYTVSHEPAPMRTMAGYVTQFFGSRGVSFTLPCESDLTYCSHRRRSDDRKCLEWLSVAVRPSVMRLIDNGKGDEVLKALGLVPE